MTQHLSAHTPKPSSHIPKRFITVRSFGWRAYLVGLSILVICTSFLYTFLLKTLQNNTPQNSHNTSLETYSNVELKNTESTSNSNSTQSSTITPYNKTSDSINQIPTELSDTFSTSQNQSLEDASHSDNLEDDENHIDHEHDQDEHDHRNVKIAYTPPQNRQSEQAQIFTPTSPSQLITEANQSALASFTGFASVSGLTQGQQNVPTNQSFSLSFDALPSMGMISSLRFYPTAPHSWSLNGNTLTIKPQRLDRNTNYTFGYQFSGFCSFDTSIDCEQTGPQVGTYTYSISFRTDWKEQYTYGISAQGRPLDAFILGFGDKTGKVIMLTGGIHGSEWRSGDLSSLKDYLWVRPHELQGQNKTIIIIPFMNPDGTAMNIRYNARGVNLNRNYPAYWAPCPQCGPANYSEPESYFWGEFAQAEKVTHLISYHAQWPPNGMIFKGADGVPAIDDFAIWIANRTGYPVGFFPGDSSTPAGDLVPGDQTVWAAAWGVKSIIIEATYIQNSDWNKNFPMYLDLVRTY